MIAAGGGDAQAESIGLATVDGAGDQPDIRKAAHDLRGAVGRSVVDDDDLRKRRMAADGTKAPADLAGLVIGADHAGYGGAAIAKVGESLRGHSTLSAASI